MARIMQIVIIVSLLLFSFSVFAADDSQDAIPQFDIKNYQVEGNTLIAADKLESILAPFTGTAKDFGTVQEAVDALEKAYRSHGFTMATVIVPEQEIKDGIIRLKVIENRIGKINIEGNRFFNEANILNSLPLHQGETPNINAVSRSLKLANENPAKKTNVLFQTSEKEDAIDANVVVKDEKPWKIGITADNTGDKETYRSRMGLLLQHANIFNRDHILTLQYITSPENPKDVNIYSMSYHVPIYSLGSSIDLIGAYSDVNSGTINVSSYDMNVSGKGKLLGLHYNQNLTRIGNYEHKVILGLDYRAYEDDVEFFGTQLGGYVTVHPLSLTYAGIYSFENIVNAGFYLTGMQNLAGTWDGRDEESNFESARTGAPRNYNMLRYGVNVWYAFFADWKVRAVLNGQYTNDQLVPGEQYGIGGANSVRGFYEREFANDRGYSMNAELYTPDLCRLIGVTFFQTRLLAFYDRGYVSRVDPLPGETHSTEIASIGPGIRITDGKRFSLSADCGFVVDPPDENTTRWSSVWHLSASILF